jgi:molybdopterin synthase catalytic subunit
MFEVTQNPILPHLILNKLKRDTHGALVSFIGTVRGYSSEGKRVLFVECEGDKEVVEQELRKLGDDLHNRWQLEDVALCHRLGRLGVGEIILVAAVAAAHRQEAFEACQYAVDRVKEKILVREVLAEA